MVTGMVEVMMVVGDGGSGEGGGGGGDSEGGDGGNGNGGVMEGAMVGCWGCWGWWWRGIKGSGSDSGVLEVVLR